jgi:hypothetical protein
MRELVSQLARPFLWTWEALVLFNRAIGHGRTLETFLASSGLVLGIVILIPNGVAESHALHLVELAVPNAVLSIPWLIYTAAGLIGIIGNVYGLLQRANTVRIVTALVGIALWDWLIIVTIQGYIVADGPLSMLALAVPAGLFSKRVCWLAWNGLPPVGYPGLWK